MKDRRKSKKTFIRYAGKWLIFLCSVCVINQLYLMNIGGKIDGFASIYAFLLPLTLAILGVTRHSDYQKKKRMFDGDEYGQPG